MTRTVSEARNNVSYEPAKGVKFSAVADTTTMSVTNNALLQGLTTFTFECWLKIDKVPTANNIFVGYYATNKGFQGYIDTTGKLVVQVGNNTTNTIFDSGANLIDIGAWNHVALVWSFANNLVRAFLRGTQVNTAGLTGGTTNNPAANFFIGNNASANRCFQGIIQEARLSNSERYTAAGFTPSNRQFTTDSNTIGLWHMDEGAGTFIADSSGNGLTGTLSGSPAPQWAGGYVLKQGTNTRVSVVA